MPGTASETLACGRRSNSDTCREPGLGRTCLLLPPPTPSPPPPHSPPSPPSPSPPSPSPPPPSHFKQSLSPSPSGAQFNDPGGRTADALTDLTQHHQYRPSVLRQGTAQASRQPLENGSPIQPFLVPGSEIQDPGPHWWSSPPPGARSPGRLAGSSPLLRFPPRRRGIPHHISPDARHRERSTHSDTGGARGLLVSGLCCWPGCDRSFEDYSSFLIHLQGEHGLSEQSLNQHRVQQDMVHYLERKLTLEKQKLQAMQLHISNTRSAESAAYDWSYSLALFLAPPPVTDGLAAPPGVVKDVVDLAQHGCWPNSPVHLLPGSARFGSSATHSLRPEETSVDLQLLWPPDCVPSLECYKYNNIRPPYTYAFLIRWSILESPAKQRSLNEIYSWFSNMFFFFRHNTATWKNAVRHNLSLHTCFVRVEGGRGAVWTVDEAEYQRRKGQKYHREHPRGWMPPYSHFRPGES